ncbi:Mu transposase domain-containing protein, partial [Paracraurococcus ruber]
SWGMAGATRARGLAPGRGQSRWTGEFSASTSGEDWASSYSEVFAEEVRHLLPLPDNPPPLLERVAVRVGKTPYARFDRNDYSIPHTHVRRVLTVLADPEQVRIVDGAQLLACHRRSYDKGAQIEQADHLQALATQKRAARQHRGTDRLAQAAPASQELLRRAAARGTPLGGVTTTLLQLLERHGAAALQAAIREALERDVPHPNAVRLALDRHREQRGTPPPVAVVLPASLQARDRPVQPHALETYDRLKDAADD